MSARILLVEDEKIFSNFVTELMADYEVITAVDGQSVATVPDISSYVNTKSVGDTVILTVLREGKQIDVPVTLGTWPANLTSGGLPRLNPPSQPPTAPGFPGPDWRHFRQPAPTQ